MLRRYFVGKRTGNGEYSDSGGGEHVGSGLADAQFIILFTAAVLGQLSPPADGGRGTVLSGFGGEGRSGSEECSHRTESAAGGAHYEKQMMQEKIFYGGQMEAWCRCVEIGLRKYIGKRCLTKIGQARQGFDACRAVSLCEGHGEKADAGFVDARGSILTGRFFAVFHPICCLRLSAFLPYQHRLANPVRNQIPVMSRIVFQQRLHLLRKLRSGKIGDFQLLTIQAFHGVNLPVEGGLERTSLCLGNQGLGDYLKGIIHDVREEPRTLVEDGTIVKTAVSGNDRNVVQVPVIVEDQAVDFKQQGQILGEQG